VSGRGELDIIREIRRRVGVAGPRTLIGIGDDAAVLEPGGDLLLLTSDVFVEDVHFRRDFASFEDIGAKCMTANVSDVAAMGGFPTTAVVGLCLPASLPDAAVEDLYDGMLRVLRTHGAEIVGGDVVSTPGGLVVSIALLGAVDKERIVPRSGAVEGDVVLVTGHLGASKAGLMSLDAGLPEDDDIGFVRDRHLRPAARVTEAQAIIDVATPHAMIDLSDGLSSDLYHIADESGVGFVVREASIPIADETRRVARRVGADATELGLSSGEEFELCVAIPASELERTIEHVKAVAGTSVTPIGEVVAVSDGCTILRADGERAPLERTGYEHLRNGKGR
jgi:thiamine-monophosphate kinase